MFESPRSTRDLHQVTRVSNANSHGDGQLTNASFWLVGAAGLCAWSGNDGRAGANERSSRTCLRFAGLVVAAAGMGLVRVDECLRPLLHALMSDTKHASL